jgi:DNA-directed RNA polymerase subunit RPC12/RpoP
MKTNEELMQWLRKRDDHGMINVSQVRELFTGMQLVPEAALSAEQKPVDEQPVADSFGHKCISCGHRFEDPINIEIDIRTTVASCPTCRSPRIDIDVPEFKPFQQPSADMVMVRRDLLESLVRSPETQTNSGKQFVRCMECYSTWPIDPGAIIHRRDCRYLRVQLALRNSAKREG